jgi:hypothetical protein
MGRLRPQSGSNPERDSDPQSGRPGGRVFPPEDAVANVNLTRR